MQRYISWFINLYPVWLVTLAVIAFFKPSTMLWFDKPWIFWSLAASLAREHFASMPLAAAAGVFSGVMQNIIGGLLAHLGPLHAADAPSLQPPQHLGPPRAANIPLARTR